MTTLIEELLGVIWPHGVPPRLEALIDPDLCGQLLADFKLAPVFPFERGNRPTRLIVAAEGERDRWRAAVARHWPSDEIEPFLKRAPAGTRWMIDSDGSEQALVFLDDLQTVDHELSAPRGLCLMCLTLELPAATPGLLTRHEEPPLDWLAGKPQRLLGQLLDAGASGAWALRWREGQVTSAAWISETRWRNNPASARRAVRVLGKHPAYDAALRCLARHGRIGYPDVVELFEDGTIDVTMGML